MPYICLQLFVGLLVCQRILPIFFNYLDQSFYRIEASSPIVLVTIRKSLGFTLYSIMYLPMFVIYVYNFCVM